MSGWGERHVDERWGGVVLDEGTDGDVDAREDRAGLAPQGPTGVCTECNADGRAMCACRECGAPVAPDDSSRHYARGWQDGPRPGGLGRCEEEECPWEVRTMGVRGGHGSVAVCTQCDAHFHIRCALDRVRRESGVRIEAISAGLTRGALCATCCLDGLENNTRVTWLLGLWEEARRARGGTSQPEATGAAQTNRVALRTLVQRVIGAASYLQEAAVRVQEPGRSWASTVPSSGRSNRDSETEAEVAAWECVVGLEAMAEAEQRLTRARPARFALDTMRAQDRVEKAARELETAAAKTDGPGGPLELMYGPWEWRARRWPAGLDRDRGGGHVWQARLTQTVLRCDVPGCVAPIGSHRDGEQWRPMLCFECEVVAHPRCAMEWWHLLSPPEFEDRVVPDRLWDSWRCTRCCRWSGRRPALYCRLGYQLGQRAELVFRVIEGRHLLRDDERAGPVIWEPRAVVLGIGSVRRGDG